jgi:hypothetical protein
MRKTCTDIQHSELTFPSDISFAHIEGRAAAAVHVPSSVYISGRGRRFIGTFAK